MSSTPKRRLFEDNNVVNTRSGSKRAKTDNGDPSIELFNFKYTLSNLGKYVFIGINNTIIFLQGLGLIAKEKNCPDCSQPMILKQDHEIDKHHWYCKCKSKKISIRKNSFFENSKLQLSTINEIMELINAEDSDEEDYDENDIDEIDFFSID